MANITYFDHPTKAAPAADDYIPIWDVSGNAAKKALRSALVGAVLTGGGAIATGGYTLTVPATGTVALLDTAQTFTAPQTVAPSGLSGSALIANMQTGTSGYGLQIQYNAVDAFRIAAVAAENSLNLTERNLGNNVIGSWINIGRNSNAGTEGPAAGTLRLRDANGIARHVWADTSGNLRIHTAAPTGSSGSPTVADTAGTVIGTQTSSRDAKNIVGGRASIDEVLAAVRQGAAAVQRFAYKNGAFGNEEFEGVIVDDAPRYGMDRDAAHPGGKSLAVVTVVGDLLRAVGYLTERVQRLEARLCELR